MARTKNPLTDNQVILAAAGDWHTRQDIANKVNRSLHPALIERIERLAQAKMLYVDEGVKPNHVKVFYYMATPKALEMALNASEAPIEQEYTQSAFA